MGPAQKSYDVKISSPFSKYERREDRFLPLTRKGRFFEDSSFSTSHQHFDDAIKKILDKWNDTDFELSDHWDDVGVRRNSFLNRYRRLRSQDLSEENQAVNVTSDNNSVKIVLDVHDFMEGDIKVQVLDEEELLIEGQTSCHSFRRTFTLPDQANLDAITSFISLDGIMTVTVPRLGSDHQQRPATIPVTVEKTKEASEMQKQSYSASSANTAEAKVSAKSDCVRNAQNITSEETRTQKEEEYEIPITRSEESEEASIKKGVRSSQNILSEETKTLRQEEFQIPIVMSEQEADSTKTQSAESDSCQFSESRKTRATENKEVIIPIIVEDGESTSQTSKQTVESKTENQETSSTLNLKTEDHSNCSTSGRRSARLSSPNTSGAETTSAASDNSKEEAYVIPVQVEAASETAAAQSQRSDRGHSASRSVAFEQQQHDLQRRPAHEDSDESSDDSFRRKAGKKRTTFADEDEYVYEKPVYPSGSRYLPITRMGLFTQDHYFEDVRPNFSQAVRDVLEMSREWTTKDKAMENYRNLRDRNLKLENQAFCVTDDEFTHKVVIDVYDFTGGDITVQLVDGKELVVEGQAEKQEATRVSRLSFIRRFQLPDLADRDAITVALSSDGVLTIYSPKRRSPRCLSVRSKRSPSARRSQERASDPDRSWREKYAHEPSEDFEDFDAHTRKSALHSFMNQF